MSKQMSEIEKMYRSAHVYPRVYGDITKETFENKVFNMVDMCNEAFTAEKQLELIKLIANRKGYPDYEYFGNLFDDYIQLLDFNEALAKLVNLIWQDITEEERNQIKDILE